MKHSIQQLATTKLFNTRQVKSVFNALRRAGSEKGFYVLPYLPAVEAFSSLLTSCLNNLPIGN
jgi:hypothetical protein